MGALDHRLWMVRRRPAMGNPKRHPQVDENAPAERVGALARRTVAGAASTGRPDPRDLLPVWYARVLRRVAPAICRKPRRRHPVTNLWPEPAIAAAGLSGKRQAG
jgi:hypothetical protein